MPYYLYEDRSSRLVRIHTGRCGRSQRGIETQRRNLTESDRTWSGPFKTLQNARRRADRTGFLVATCSHCVPSAVQAPPASSSS